MTKTIAIISDTQIPYHDSKALKAVVRFIGEYQPDEVIHIGDVMDFPQPSRWTKGTAGEFEGSVFEDSEFAKRNFLTPLREGYSGPIGFHEGNHDLRARHYLSKYAPALAESGSFDTRELLDFQEYEITQLPDFHEIGPGWLSTHGHRGRHSISDIAGNTALNAAKNADRSIVMGHTHRLGQGSHSVGYDGKVTRTVTGTEIGNLMNMKQADYLKGGAGNWQQGFGMAYVSGNHVSVRPIMISKKKFVVDGGTYEWR